MQILQAQNQSWMHHSHRHHDQDTMLHLKNGRHGHVEPRTRFACGICIALRSAFVMLAYFDVVNAPGLSGDAAASAPVLGWCLEALRNCASVTLMNMSKRRHRQCLLLTANVC
jgi:hypothetical protein